VSVEDNRNHKNELTSVSRFVYNWATAVIAAD